MGTVYNPKNERKNDISLKINVVRILKNYPVLIKNIENKKIKKKKYKIMQSAILTETLITSNDVMPK